MTEKMTQCARIAEYLQKHGSITQKEAITDLGCFRLASRICDLKRMGYDITGEMVPVQNRFGETCRIKKYSMREG